MIAELDCPPKEQGCAARRFPGGLSRVTARMSAAAEGVLTGTSSRGKWAALVALTKPRIIELLLVTTVPSMVIAADGWPGTALVAATLVGGAFSAAGANALNCYFDRRIDGGMKRTARRPLPAGEVSALAAAMLGAALGVVGFVWLAFTTNLLAASLSTVALLYYVFVYTVWLKRKTDQNIVIGGAAGAFPALVGWAAVTADLGFPAWILFLVVFYWTPTHFWALALRYRSDYERAGVPMLPVTKGELATAVNMLAYAVLTVFASLLLTPVAGLSWGYSIAAVALGGWFIVETWRVANDTGRAMTLFVRSTYYLAVLFGVVAADVLISA